jgi:hypothetical protein
MARHPAHDLQERYAVGNSVAGPGGSGSLTAPMPRPRLRSDERRAAARIGEARSPPWSDGPGSPRSWSKADPRKGKPTNRSAERGLHRVDAAASDGDRLERRRQARPVDTGEVERSHDALGHLAPGEQARPALSESPQAPRLVGTRQPQHGPVEGRLVVGVDEHAAVADRSRACHPPSCRCWAPLRSPPRRTRCRTIHGATARRDRWNEPRQPGTGASVPSRSAASEVGMELRVIGAVSGPVGASSLRPDLQHLLGDPGPAVVP